MPYCIPDDPIIRSMERTGRPPWENTSRRIWNAFGGYACEDDEWEEDDDAYYGSETDEF